MCNFIRNWYTNMLGERNGEEYRFLLVYGSETGQAQAIAEEIAEKAPTYGLKADLHCLDQTGKKFNIEEEKCMVMVTSTTGDGDAPANASKFLRKIKKRTLGRDYLAHLHFALLGLGDTNYTNFCRCARDMEKRLGELGAQKFYSTGFADDGVGLEMVVEPWLEGLYPALQSFLHVRQTNSGSDLVEHLPALNIGCAGDTDNSAAASEISNKISSKRSEKSPVESEKARSIPSGDVVVKDTLAVISNSTARTSENGDHASSEVHSGELKREEILDAGDSSRVSSINGNVVNNVTASQLGIGNDPCETTCVRVEVHRPPPDTPSLLHSRSHLATRPLTVPALPPVFLCASFSEQSIKLSGMSYQNGCKLPSAASDIHQVPVVAARVLTHPEAVKKTLLLRLSIKDTKLDYSPGDAISVICPNSTSEVDLLLQRLGVSEMADWTVTLSVLPDTKKRRAAVPPHIHPTTSLRQVFTTCVCIRDSPSKAFIRALVDYTSDAGEARRMQELCSKEGAEEYTRFVREQHISLLDFLFGFPSCRPPVERILEFLPRLQPRPYSVCSCQSYCPDSLDVVFNVVNIPALEGQGHYYSRRGVCTGWLDDITSCFQSRDDVTSVMPEKIEIPVFMRTNQHFRPPEDLSKPLILIGPGTGIAPFIGFLQERALKRKQLEAGSMYGETWLFYGCRNKDKDYLFRKELADLQADGTVMKLCVSFSQDADSPHRYIQDFMRSESKELARCLTNDDPLVYVCGDAKNMAKDINAAFEEIMQKESGLSTDDARMFIMKKRIHKTYLEDVWV